MKRELKRELDNELPPMELREGVWTNVMSALLNNRGKFQPVYFTDSETGEKLGEFFVHLLTRGNDTFVQFQGFDNLPIQQEFVRKSEDLEMVQPGIYRIKLS